MSGSKSMSVAGAAVGAAIAPAVGVILATGAVVGAAGTIAHLGVKAVQSYQDRLRREREAAERREREIQQRIAQVRARVRSSSGPARVSVSLPPQTKSSAMGSGTSDNAIKAVAMDEQRQVAALRSRLPGVRSEYEALISQDLLDAQTVRDALQLTEVAPFMRPRAILLEGFPGCGKSFIARAIAQEWRVPQINFEISRLQSKWVGESESNTYQALRAIEASAPNILFMDEIEKAFSGVGGDSSGVTTRQFGTFLSWLNDHNYPIFFIATSNDRDKLPPELFRAGRFDEIFIVMPPNGQERKEIIQKKAQTSEIRL